MVVRSINGYQPIDGVVNLPLPTMIDVGHPFKIWAGTALTNSDGNWSIDYSDANFSQVKSIQVSIESSITNASEKPLGTYVSSKNLTNASGRCYSVTSAGLLAAMQQTAVGEGVMIHVFVIGV